MDSRVVLWLNGEVGNFKIWDAFIQTIMSDYLVPVTCSLVMLGLWFHGPKQASRIANQIAVCIAAGGIGAANLSIAISNTFYYRPRPFEVFELNLLFYQPTDSSFPSNFAAVGFAVSTAVMLRNKKLGILLAFLTLIGGGGRVYAGVHYPSDILGGALFGIFATLFAYLISKRLSFALRLFLKLARTIHFA